MEIVLLRLQPTQTEVFFRILAIVILALRYRCYSQKNVSHKYAFGLDRLVIVSYYDKVLILIAFVNAIFVSQHLITPSL